MQLRPLGNSGISVSRIGFGCGDNAGLMTGPDTALQTSVVGRALEAGITYFDTAAKYGRGRSEVNLGQALRAHGAAEVVIGTKLELAPDSTDSFVSQVRENLAASLTRLETERIDLYQLHDRIGSASTGGWAPAGARRLSPAEILDPGGLGDALIQMKDEGRLCALGLTTFGGDPAAVAEVVDSGIFDALNCSFHLLNPSALLPPLEGWPALNYSGVGARAAERGMAVLGIRGLGGGKIVRLNSSRERMRDSTAGAGDSRLAAPPAGADREHPDLVWTEQTADLLWTELSQHGTSATRAAMSWVLQWPEVSTMIGGFSHPAHVDDAVAAESDPSPWTPEEARAWCHRLYATSDSTVSAESA